jgi:hypothetical protein
VDANAPGAPPATGTDTSGGAGGGASSPTSDTSGLGSASPGGLAASPGATGAPASGNQSAQGASGGGGSGSTPLQYRNASSNTPSQGWLTFLLTMLSGLVILGTAFGVGGTISRMAKAWRESVSPLG